MNSPSLTRSLSIAILVFLAACSTPPTTSLRVDTDPPGADVENPTLGFLGTTPLPLTLDAKDLKKLGSGSRVSLDLTISKKGFVTVVQPASWEKGTNHTIKKILQARLDQVEITSEPVGVGIFQLVLESVANASEKSAFTADPLLFYKGNPRATPPVPGNPQLVTQQFLGSTPTSYKYDPENALQNNEPLLFQKEGYEDQIVLFKVSQKRIHRIMKKVK